MKRLLFAFLLVAVTAWAVTAPATTAFAGNQLAAEQPDARFQRLLNEGFDVEAVSSFVLAKYWRRASDSEKQSFQTVFADVLTSRFLPVFDLYQDGMTMEVDRVTEAGDSGQVFDVFSTLARPGEEPVKIAWRLLQRDEKFRIVDVRVENLSMAITLRSEYTTLLQRNGGSVAGLVNELKDRLAEGSLVDPALSQIN